MSKRKTNHILKIFHKKQTKDQPISETNLKAQIPSDTVEDYYRKNMFIPLLDIIISDFNQKFDRSSFIIFTSTQNISTR